MVDITGEMHMTIKLTESVLRRIIREEIEGLEGPAASGLAKFKVVDASTGKAVVYPTPNTVIFKGMVADYMRKVALASTPRASKKSMQSIIDDYDRSYREPEAGEDEYMYVRDPDAQAQIADAIKAGAVLADPQKVYGFSRSLRRTAIGHSGRQLPGQVEALSAEEKAAAPDLGVLMVASPQVAAAPAPIDTRPYADTSKELPGAEGLRHLDMARDRVGPYRR